MNNEEEEEKLFEIYRSVDGLLDRAWMLLNDITVSLDAHQYIYAAIDLRMCIERIMSGLLRVIKGEELNKNQQNLYRIKDFVYEIKSIDANYEETILIKFNKIIQTHNPGDIIYPDFERLSKIYGELGNVLHVGESEKLIYETDEDLDRLENLILESYEYLQKYRNYSLVWKIL